MIPRGAQPLIDRRLQNWRPQRPVWIQYGDFLEPAWWRYIETKESPEILVRPEDPIEQLDLRCVVGLLVTYVFREWDVRVARLYERLQDYAAEIIVMSPCFDLDCGWFWVRGYGEIAMNERWRLTQMKDAQADCIAASVKGDKVAYAAAQARELEAITGAPWLKG